MRTILLAWDGRACLWSWKSTAADLRAARKYATRFGQRVFIVRHDGRADLKFLKQLAAKRR